MACEVLSWGWAVLSVQSFVLQVCASRGLSPAEYAAWTKDMLVIDQARICSQHLCDLVAQDRESQWFIFWSVDVLMPRYHKTFSIDVSVLYVLASEASPRKDATSKRLLCQFRLHRPCRFWCSLLCAMCDCGHRRTWGVSWVRKSVLGGLQGSHRCLACSDLALIATLKKLVVGSEIVLANLDYIGEALCWHAQCLQICLNVFLGWTVLSDVSQFYMVTCCRCHRHSTEHGPRIFMT